MNGFEPNGIPTQDAQSPADTQVNQVNQVRLGNIIKPEGQLRRVFEDQLHLPAPRCRAVPVTAC